MYCRCYPGLYILDVVGNLNTNLITVNVSMLIT